MERDRKFRNFWGSSFAVRKISDRLCAEHGLSIIETPKPSRGSYGSWLGDKKPSSKRDALRDIINSSILDGMDFTAFIAAMKQAGCEVKRGKHLSFKAAGQQRFIRCDSLGEDYTEQAIRERLTGKRVVAPKPRTTAPEKVNLLIDIQSRIQQANRPGFEQWLKVFNLKESAKTLVFLQENGLTSFADLEREVTAATDNFHGLANQIRRTENRMAEITTLQQYIGAYAKTREVYRQYKSSGYSKKCLAQHERAIQLHRSAKQHFNSLGLTKLPTIQLLKQEYASLLANKKKLYGSYKAQKEKMVALLTAKNNVDRILGAAPSQHDHREEQH